MIIMGIITMTFLYICFGAVVWALLDNSKNDIPYVETLPREVQSSVCIIGGFVWPIALPVLAYVVVHTNVKTLLKYYKERDL